MHRSMIVGLAVLLLAVAGCGSSPQPYTDHSQDPEAYAKNVKHLILGATAQAKHSREPAEDLRAIVTELGQTDRPQGSYQSTYAEILNLARPLMQECEQAPNGKPSGLNQKLDEIAKIAEKLPGEVTIAPPEQAPTSPVVD